MSTLADELDWDKMNGLIPAVVTHSVTGSVLMVAWCNKPAVEKTVGSGKVTFYSRSRQELWTKGDTSGNTLTLTSARTDCDRDTLLFEAIPSGPVCHTGTQSCFDTLQPAPGLGFLGELEKVIQRRRDAGSSDASYTAELFAKGLPKIAQKVGEEGVEVALAGVLNSTEDLKNESADLLYHLIVLLAAHDVSLEDVVSVLRDRHVS
ncbi:MAG: bifunctional phosphoribosyl-AMP cyclohydrolase/phosphoribosyl-ATP diphosphatase HisIE [Gammaproteobacteria bacterium]